MRDDSVLNTGASSAAFGSTRAQQVLEAKKVERSDETREVKNFINPNIKPILDIIQEEIDSLYDIRNFSGIDTKSPQHVSDELRARQIAETRLLAIKRRIQNIQRAK